MYSKRIATVALSIVFCLVIVGVASGGNVQSLPGSNWWVSFQVQNVDTQAGTLVLSAYTQDDVAAAQYDSDGFTIAAGGGLTYNPGFAPSYSTGGNRIGFCASASNCDSTDDDLLPVGFHGSVVASSDVSIVAVGYVANSLNGSVGSSSGHAGGNYAAMSTGASELLFPIAKHNFAGNTTAYYVQAAGVDATVTITYTMNDGSIHTETTLIPANRTHLFDPANATPPVASTGCTPAATSPCLGSAKLVASSGQVVGVALEYQHGVSPAVILGATRAFVPDDYSTTVLAPVFKNDWYGQWSGLQIQNTTAITANVVVTFTVSGSVAPGVSPGKTYVQSSLQIAPYNQTVLSKYRANIGGMPAGISAAAVIVSDQPVVAIHNESNNTGYPAAMSSYNCFSPGNATQRIALPLVKEYFYGGRLTPHVSRGGTAVAVQNAGTANATIGLRYIAVGGPGVAVGTAYTVTIGLGQGAGGTQLLAPGASYVFNMVSDPGRAFRYAGVGTGLPTDNVNYVVSVTADQPIIAFAQEDHKPPAGTTPNDLLNYEGFNLP